GGPRSQPRGPRLGLPPAELQRGGQPPPRPDEPGAPDRRRLGRADELRDERGRHRPPPSRRRALSAPPRRLVGGGGLGLHPPDEWPDQPSSPSPLGSSAFASSSGGFAWGGSSPVRLSRKATIASISSGSSFLRSW